MLMSMKCSRKRPAWHVARMVDEMSANCILLGTSIPEGTNHVEERGIDISIILKLILCEW